MHRIVKIPTEILLYICGFLSRIDIVRLSESNKRLKEDIGFYILKTLVVTKKSLYYLDMNLDHLTNISICGCGIVEFVIPPNVTSLNISNNNLTELILTPKLTSLKACHNKIKGDFYIYNYDKNDVEYLWHKFVYIDLSYNEITGLIVINEVDTLNVNNNKIEKILIRENIKSDYYQHEYNEISIHELNVSYNLIKGIDYITHKNFKYLYDKSLDIYDLQLNLSDEFYKINNKVLLIGIKEIDISYNCITYLKVRIRVNSINASHNEIKDFLFDSNESISHLDLSFNNLTIFGFKNMGNHIYRLNLSNNQNLTTVYIEWISIGNLLLKNNPNLNSINIHSRVENIILHDDGPVINFSNALGLKSIR